MKFRYLFVIFFTVIAVFAGCKKKPAHPENPLDFSNKYSITSSFDEKTSVFTIKVELAENLHAYAKGEKIGKPVRLEISEKNGWKALGQTKVPKGFKKKFGTQESVVIKGAFALKQKLIKGKNGAGEAELHLQVCSEKSCDRPRKHKLTIE